ncbi:MAG: hypothetical protein K6G30_14075 [Acetatifactor sp.]|nr:hypothetical protein [Acetatifactor sp.]
MRHSKSGILLMELILVILFFAMASTVCIKLFSKAHLKSVLSVNQNHAVIEAQNLAEYWLATEGSPEKTSLYFDTNWEKCSEETACFSAILTSAPSSEADLIEACISVIDLQTPTKPIYQLNLIHHVAKRRMTYAD